MKTKLRTTMRLLLVAFAFSAPGQCLGDAVTDWNELATTLTPAAGKSPLHESRIYAMVHVAVHDSLNAIERRYNPYTLDTSAPQASPEAAVAAAVYHVLLAEISSQQAALDAAYTAFLSTIADGSAKLSGIALGEEAAAAILSLRNNDGSTAIVPYTPGGARGNWAPTPPAFFPAFLPGWGEVTPFTLNSAEQFLPDPPGFFDLAGEEFARDYHEVKGIGDVNSMTRTAEQSEIARFWYGSSPTGWNQIARVVSMSAGLDTWENGRLFALINLAMADGYIAGFKIKYHYSFWRPVTAIQTGGGTLETPADPLWLPFLITPHSPDFPSTHAVLGEAAARVLASFFETDFVSFTTTSVPPFPGITRSFDSFGQASRENAESRIYAGIHFRSARNHGLRVGEKIGMFAFKHFLGPVRPGTDSRRMPKPCEQMLRRNAE